jgi:hypothetical protein
MPTSKTASRLAHSLRSPAECQLPAIGCERGHYARPVSAVGDRIAQIDALPGERSGNVRALLRRPWALALALAIPLAIGYLIWMPPAADLAAATYRSDLFARVGYTLRDNGWYAAHGHYLLGYSLLSPALGALLGVRVLMVISVLAACALFGLIAERVFGSAAGRAAALVFAFGICVELLSGRVPYDLGLAIGLGSVLALMRGRAAVALVLALLCSCASPVAGAFLALVYLAWGLTALVDARRTTRMLSPVGLSANAGRAQPADAPSGGPCEQLTPTGGPVAADPTQAVGEPGEQPPPIDPQAAGRTWAWPIALTIAALTPIAILAVAFPEGGYEPFAGGAFWPAFAGVVLIAVFVPRGPLSARAHRAVRIGAGMYALAMAGSFLIQTPMGGNAARLGPELAPALLTGVLWDRRRLALCLLAPVLLYWQLNTPIGDESQIYGQESVHASYYTPLLGELRRLRGGSPTIVEVPLTAAHWEAAYVTGHDGIKLARGWERQLDTRYAALFYRPHLNAAAYRAWLDENRVVYVALPDALPDYSSEAEVELIEHGLPYLHEIWRSRHWRLFEVLG